MKPMADRIRDAKPDLDGYTADEAFEAGWYAALSSQDGIVASEPHMDSSNTVSVEKHYDGRPGTVSVRVPAGYVLVQAWDLIR